MQFNYSYRGETAVENRTDRTDMSFSPDLTRQPTFFRGALGKPLEFREAISALHDVVVSDLRFQPKDKTEYKAWAAQQEQIDWQQVAEARGVVTARMKTLQEELTELDRRAWERMKPYQKAQQLFFKYLYDKAKDLWFVLDPVITIHPDQLFFECFSQDESTYGCLGVGHDVFRDVGEFACGTTNVDYSAALYDEFQKIRSYKTTHFEVDPRGFNVETSGEDLYREVKIDLPDTWVRGFLQVSSAMTLPAVAFDLHPMDVHNLCFVLRRHKEKRGPRAMRYRLKPGEPVRVFFEPWETEVACPRSIYQGAEAREIRVWGRRRILTLERLIPVAKRFTVHLLGQGLPSFYVADLGDMWFTLGLSGWTANDWSTAGNFDLLAPRADVDELTKRRVFAGLQERWFDTADGLAKRLELDRATVAGALSAYAQAGRVIYDINRGVYRVRELSREPLPMDRLRFANPREESATRFMAQNQVVVSTAHTDTAGALHLSGTVTDKNKVLSPSLTIDGDERITAASCTCNWHQQNKLYKGPCEHILALRMQHNRARGAVAGATA